MLELFNEVSLLSGQGIARILRPEAKFQLKSYAYCHPSSTKENYPTANYTSVFRATLISIANMD